jgi:hypothetical protein
VVALTLTGDAAIRASFLDNPTLLMAFGGFNPHFTPPDDFPDLDRLAVVLDTGDTLRLSISGYFALTSNTVQFGAAVDLVARISEITAEGHFGFDALIYFNPFGFVIDYGFSVSVSVGALELCGVHLALTLEGPNPWYALGTAVVTVLGIDTDFRVEETIGSRKAEGPQATVSARTLLIKALQDPAAWTEVPPAADAGAVVLAGDDGTDTAVRVHPAGMLQVLQRVVPLERTLDHYGQATLDGGDRFELTAATLGGQPATSTSTVEDWFAPAQYFTLSEVEKLSSPSFERMPGGLRMGDDGIDAGPAEPFTLDYEQIVRDPERHEQDREVPTTFQPPWSALAAAVSRSAAARARTAARLPASTTPASPFALGPARFVATNTATGAVARALTPASGVPWSVAREAVLGRRPDRGRQITPQYETEGAAT